MKRIKPRLISKNPKIRLHGVDKPIIGLTGGIATGKSTVANALRAQGFDVIDADQLVKSIYQMDESKKFIGENWPEAVSLDEILFPKLREIFFKDAHAKKEIENFIYERLPDAFQKTVRKSSQEFIIYDVPLLFEKGLDQLTDLNVVVYSPRALQTLRVMKRDGINLELANQILDQQEDIEKKKDKADFVILNCGDEKELAAEIQKFLLQVLD